MSSGPGRSRGFTLLEIMITVAIIGVMSALSFALLDGLRSRTSFGSEAGAVDGALRRARAEAYGRGRTVAFVVDPSPTTPRWWIVDAGINFNLSTFNPNNPANVIEQGTLNSARIGFGPTAGYNKALPLPYSGVPVLAAKSPVKPFCSFCGGGPTGTDIGAIYFDSSGGARFSAGPSSAPGQQFTLSGTELKTGLTRTRVYIVVAANGLIDTFEE